ncbi:hypothetical protein [Micromonospora sp. ATA51]|uniref:hypothetical protein n=1 Tax=Micromonospora sp. ATA51 TaxID=2806098 RepID=UPI001A36FACA|nr:hypothetical protein [Micromonospora sp. ATA51]MBM0225372.1 hypothetical protein [Micromonospora sp. ATA51]
MTAAYVLGSWSWSAATRSNSTRSAPRWTTSTAQSPPRTGQGQGRVGGYVRAV